MMNDSNASRDGDESAGKKSWFRRALLEWGVILGIAALLYLTGLHTEVLGRLQQAVLWTGLMQPETELAEAERVSAGFGMRIAPLNEAAAVTTEPGATASRLGDFRGQVIFLNFWATWCAPCIAEMPNIQALYEEMGDREDLVFVMVSVDESSDRARAFLERKGFTFPAWHLRGGRSAELSSGIIPTTYVIGRDGTIVSRSEGMANYNTRRFRDFLQEQLER